MLLALILSSAIPDAYGDRGLIFALAYVGIQAGRTAFVVVLLGRDHAMAPNYRRMLGWLSVSGAFWIAALSRGMNGGSCCGASRCCANTSHR